MHMYPLCLRIHQIPQSGLCCSRHLNTSTNPIYVLNTSQMFNTNLFLYVALIHRRYISWKKSKDFP